MSRRTRDRRNGDIPHAINPALVIFGPSLVLDLDSRFVTLAAGPAVAAMQDQSGNGFNATQVGAAQPGYSPNGGVRGLPKLTLNGTQNLCRLEQSRGIRRRLAPIYAVMTPTAASVIAARFCNTLSSPHAVFLCNAGRRRRLRLLRQRRH